MNNFTVVKSVSRKYGYALHSEKKLDYVYDGHNFAWYKYKYKAQERAKELNQSGVNL